MPRGVYDRSKARRRRRTARPRTNSITSELESAVKQLNVALERVRQLEGFRQAIEPFFAGAVAAAPATGRRRGRPPKNATVDGTMPRRRGRPPKNATAMVGATEAPRRRGRPPKNATAMLGMTEAPRRRGRPPKNATASAGETAPRRRGRPPKNPAAV